MNIFRKIEDFEELYEIDNDGNVKSLRNDIILKPRISRDGYYYLSLYKNGKHYTKKPHRLVAETFLPNPDNLPSVNHKDENKLNNHIELTLDSEGNVVVDYEKSNLEWCTVKYNINHGTRNERMAAKHRGVLNTKTSKPVIAVKDGVVVMEFPSTKEAGRQGFNHGNVSACCNNCYCKLGNYYKDYQWYFKSDWLEMKNAVPHKRETA